MKKTNIFKIALTLVLAISLSTTFAQEIEGGAGVILTVDHTVDQYVTVDKALPYHVMPDSYFNPNYNAGGGWLVTSTFAWSFSTVAGGTPAFSNATVINPDITLDFVGDYVLDVVESSATCGGSTRQMNIHVLDVPDLGFTVVDPADVCGDVVATDVLFNIAVNGEADYLVDWNIDVDNLSADKLTVTDSYDGSGDAFNPSTTDLDVATVDDVFANSGSGLVLTNQAFPVLNGEVTRYTFTLTGINGAVSRVSDFVAPNGRVWPIATFTDYPVTGGASGDATFVLTVLPAPTTGAIYHIANI